MILTGQAIASRMQEGALAERLHITPLLPGQFDVESASVDVHLGQDFLAFDRPRVPYIDPAPNLGNDQGPRPGGPLEVPPTRHHHVPWGDVFTLHPQAFALAATLEYISLPLNLTAHVLGRSTWARVGLVIAMATLVHPGYAGCLTLELQNLGSAPLVLRPGLRVAQLVLEDCTPLGSRPFGQITCAVQPEARELLSPRDLALLKAATPR